MQAVPMVIQAAPAARPAYRRRYRPRKRYRRRKLSRALRTFRNARRKYPASQYGYTFVPRTESTAAAFGPSYREASEAQRQDRINSRYYGRGVYTGQGSFWKKAAHYAWKHRGKVLDAAAMAGVPGASALRRIPYVGGGVYTGQGSYEGANGLFGNETADVPIVESSGTEEGSIKISHREYLTDLYGNPYNTTTGVNTKPFDLSAYEINPGLEQTFPWLSQIAQNFEEYELEQCIFSFRSTVQEVSSANGQVGTITMATVYNPDSPNFRDKTEMMQYAHSNSVKATDDIMHGVECDDSKLSGTDEKYIRSGPLDQNLQKKDYDHGRFQVAISNTPLAFSNGSIGELWISYTVVLRKPKVFTARGQGISEFLCYTDLKNGLKESGAIEDSTYNPFVTVSGGDPFLYSRKNSLNMKLITNTNKLQLIFPASAAGLFKVILSLKVSVTGSSTAQNTNLATPRFGGNVTEFNDILDAWDGTTLTTNVDWTDSQKALGLNGNPTYYKKTFGTDEDAGTNLIDQTMAWLHLELHVRVAPVNNALDNDIVWDTNYVVRGTGAPLSSTDKYIPFAAQIQVTELPSGLIPSFVDDSYVEREVQNAQAQTVNRIK